MQNLSYNFEEFDISDESVPITKFGANRANNDATRTPYPTRKSNNFNLGSPVKGYGYGKFGQENNAAFDSKLDGIDFAISESDNHKFSPGRGINNTNNNRLTNILSPQVTSSEMKRHFNDFSSAFPNNNANNFDNKNFDNDFSFDQSIEVGRSTKPNLYGDNKLFSFSSNSPRKVPGSLHQGNSPLTFEKRYSNYRRPDSNHEKVTSSSSSPKEPKIATKNFKIPQGYGDNASFFESIGMKNILSEGTDYDKKKRGAKATIDPIPLPDISGLSSIFSSEESTRNKGQKKENSQHKVLKNFPLDSDEKALFSALSNFQAKVTKLEEEKRKAYSELERMRDDQQLLKDDYKKLRQELVNARQQIDYDSRVTTQLEQKARKYKTMAASLKDYTKSLEDSMKNGTPQDVFELRQRLENMNSKYMGLNEENDNVSRMLNDRDYELAQRRTEIRNLQAEVSRLKNELATAGFKSGNKYSDDYNDNLFNRPISSSNRQYVPSRRPVSRNPSGYNPAPFTAPVNNPEYQPYNINPPADASKPNVQFVNPAFGPQQQQQPHFDAQQGVNGQPNHNYPAGSAHYNANSINGNNPFSNQATGNGQYPNNNFVNNGQATNPAFNGNSQYNTAEQQQQQPQQQQAGPNNPLPGTFNPLGSHPQVNQPSATNQFIPQTANGQSANFHSGVNQFNGLAPQTPTDAAAVVASDTELMGQYQWINN
ncbi:hypothetical protein D0Z00_000048 [Geotrichum galactomycetum]|uniref:Uncharacterized protein n=1 Tax=Geotrichum galactomycetum TaxID=27317 RepID=A0ACB6VB07_9ASCO|nr:hypothetical protein D0Z00_000048 [Geotrichum candidum]